MSQGFEKLTTIILKFKLVQWSEFCDVIPILREIDYSKPCFHENLNLPLIGDTITLVHLFLNALITLIIMLLYPNT